MPDLSKCPSCGVEPDTLKLSSLVVVNGWRSYNHREGCTVGRATRITPVGVLAGYQLHRYRCSRCEAEFTMSDEGWFPYYDGSGTGSRDCPICWATAEASAKRQ